MKFGENLTAHITPEWHKQYIKYETMKDMLYEAVEQAPSDDADEEEVRAYFARFDESFFRFCDQELRKINTFFSEKLAEVMRKLAGLQSDLTAAEEAEAAAATAGQSTAGRALSILRRRRNSTYGNTPIQQSHRSMRDIKLAFSEFYLGLILLQNYQTLNFTGFRKILKKHDKLTRSDRGAHWRQANVETAQFYTSKEVDHLIKEIENLFIEKLEGGNRQKAMKRLRVPPLGETENPWTTFRVGFFSGMFLILAIVAVTAAAFLADNHAIDWKPALRIYRGTFLIILFLFLLGINVYGWRTSGVNHVLIFELNPRDHLTHQQFIELAAFLACLWCLSLIGYLFGPSLSIPKYIFPLLLSVLLIVYLLNPLHILHYRARRWLLKVLFCIFTAPFHHVGFADFWLADQLNSLTIVLLDFEFLICFYTADVKWLMGPHAAAYEDWFCGGMTYGVRPFISCLPAWFRFAQCLRRYRDTRLAFPHIVNAGKYSTTFFVVLFSTLYKIYKSQHGDEVIQNNAFFYLWIISAIINTCYTLAWDIKMDWGLLDRNAGENFLLREEIVYPHKSYYYLAVVEDLIHRCTWTLDVAVGQTRYADPEILRTILASLEVFRRFVWNFFRLENEHLNNCGQFRAVRDISIAPIDSNDQALLERMMDEDDGVLNRSQASLTKWQRIRSARDRSATPESSTDRRYLIDNDRDFKED